MHVGDRTAVHCLDGARRQVAHHRHESFVQPFVLPDADDGPAALHQACGRVLIPLDVRLQLQLPPHGVVCWPCSVLWAAMPEAAIDEDSDPTRGEHDVSPSPGDARERCVHAVPIAEAMESSPERDLWSGVTRPLLRQSSGSRWIPHQRRGSADRGGSVGGHVPIMLRVEDQCV